MPRSSTSPRRAARKQAAPHPGGHGLPAPSRPHPVDVHVGAVLRAKRKAAGWRLVDLADQLGVSLQQVQKHESGEVRMAASVLAAASAALGAPVDTFFAGLPDPTHAPDALARRTCVGRFLTDPDSQDIAAALAALPPDQRRGVLVLMRSLMRDPDDGAAGPTRSPPPDSR